jgi:hypothetical protein
MQSVLRMGADGNTMEYQSSMPSEPKFLLSDLGEESVPNICVHGGCLTSEAVTLIRVRVKQILYQWLAGIQSTPS